MWTFIDIVVLKGFSFVATIILARLLGPAEFGLIGMIYVFIAIGTTLVDSGLSSSLIRTIDANDDDFCTVFYTNVGLSVIVYLFFFFCAPFIALFYKQEILTALIRLYCLSFIISSFSSIQISIFTKNMQFKKLMFFNLPGTIIGICVGVTMGYLRFGVWSIIWMYLVTQLVQSTLLWIASPWKPSLKFSSNRLKYHFNFGYKLLLSGVIDTVFQNIYNVVIGRNYSVKTLGYYERAYIFNQYPVTVLTGIIGKVTYPLIANIQDQKERVAFIYKKILQVTFFATAPLMLGASAIAKPLFILALGKEWLPAVPFFQIICLGSIFYPIHSFNINILKVYDRTDLFLKLEVIKKIVISFGVGLGFIFGIYGLVWSSVITSFVALVINTHYSQNIINYSTKNQLLDMLPIFILSVLMSLIMLMVLPLLTSFNNIIQVLLTSIIGICAYLAASFLFKIPSFIYLTNLIKNRKL